MPLMQLEAHQQKTMLSFKKAMASLFSHGLHVAFSIPLPSLYQELSLLSVLVTFSVVMKYPNKRSLMEEGFI